jgi:hypothetical protein
MSGGDSGHRSENVSTIGTVLAGAALNANAAAAFLNSDCAFY